MADSPRRSADPGQQVWALMHRFVEAHNRRGELAEALGFRLGGGRGKILFQLRDGPMTPGRLAQRNNLDAPYATLIVDKLEAHGLVERRPHPDDKRRKLVTLTAAGHDAIEAADAILLRPPTAIGNLPADDLSRLAELLTRLLDADADAADGAEAAQGVDAVEAAEAGKPMPSALSASTPRSGESHPAGRATGRPE
jgi:DNA-binding MarR family transcriptional regulator